MRIRETARDRLSDLHKGLVLLHPDRADAVTGNPARIADLRQKPARFGAAGMANRQLEPGRRTEFAPFARCARFRRRQGIGQHLRRRPPLAPQTHEGRSNLFGTKAGQKRVGHGGLIPGRAGQGRMFQNPQVILGLHIIRTRRRAPFGDNLGTLEQTLRLAEL